MADTTIIRGDSNYWDISFVDEDGDAYDLSGCTVWLVAKPKVDNDLSDSAAIISHKIVIDGSGTVTSSNGLLLGGIRPDGSVATTAAHGYLTDKLTPSESSLIAPGNYVFDLQIKDEVGDVWTPIVAMPFGPVVGDVARNSS